MVYYKLIKVIIKALSFTKVIIDVIVRYHGLFNFIAINQMFDIYLRVVVMAILFFKY